MTVSKNVKVQITLTPDTTLDDVEALVAEARDTFGDGPVKVGAEGNQGGVFLFATDAEVVA